MNDAKKLMVSHCKPVIENAKPAVNNDKPMAADSVQW